MNLTPQQQEMVERVASWVNRAIPASPLVLVPRWRLQEWKHEGVDNDSLDLDFDRYKRLGLIVSLVPMLLPYRYRLLFSLAQRLLLARHWHRLSGPAHPADGILPIVR